MLLDNEVDKNTDERNHDNNNNGHKPPENTSASTNTVPASTNQGPTSISTSTSSGNVTNSGTPHNNTVKKKANTKFKYTYEDRISVSHFIVYYDKYWFWWIFFQP